MLAGYRQDRPTRAADAWVDYYEVHRSGREVVISLGERQSAVKHVVRLNHVADIYELRARVDSVWENLKAESLSRNADPSTSAQDDKLEI